MFVQVRFTIDKWGRWFLRTRSEEVWSVESGVQIRMFFLNNAIEESVLQPSDE